jgi:hypothetical protein
MNTMKKVLVMPVLAVTMLVGACDGDPTTVDTRASVRFFNATTGLTGNGGFTTNGQFVSGSAVGFGQASSTCRKVDAGSTSFGFGTAASGGSALSGNALATLSSQTITAGGNYTVVATGSATSPALFLLDNYAGTVGTNQASVRFVNLAPGTIAAPNTFNVFIGGLPPTGTLVSTNIVVGEPTAFSTVTSGANSFVVLKGHEFAVSGSEGMLTLQGGTVNTLAIIPDASTGGFRLVNITGC